MKHSLPHRRSLKHKSNTTISEASEAGVTAIRSSWPSTLSELLRYCEDVLHAEVISV